VASNVRIPPPPLTTKDEGVWSSWYVSIVNAINNLAAFPHNSLNGIQGGATNDNYHLTAVQYNDLTDGGSTSLHTHAAISNHNSLSGLQGGTASEYYHLTSAQYTSLSSGLSVTITTAPVTGGGATGSMTFTNGILTAQTQAT